MKNAFPTLEAYNGFERLLQFSSESRENHPVFRVWEPLVSSDDDLADSFTQHFPATENILRGAWLLQELEPIKEVTYSKNANESQPALVTFVAVSHSLHSEPACGPYHILTSMLLLRCIQRSSKHILTARHLYLHLV